MGTTRVVFYGGPFIKAYIAKGLPKMTDPFNADYVWIPRWLWATYISLYTRNLDHMRHDVQHATIEEEEEREPLLDLMGLRLSCVAHIYNDEGLNAKYSALYALSPSYETKEELTKDLGHLDCFKELVGAQ